MEQKTMRMWRAWFGAGAMVVLAGCGSTGSEIKKPEEPKVEVPKVDPYVAECMATLEGVTKASDQAGKLARMKEAPAEQAALTAWPLNVKGFTVALPSGAYRGLRFVLKEGRLSVFYLGEKTRVMVDEQAMSAMLAELPPEETEKAFGKVDDWSKYSEGLISEAPSLYTYNQLGFKYGLDGVNCEKKGRGYNTLLMVAYPFAGSFAASLQASAVFMPAAPPAPAEGEEPKAPLEGMIFKGKTVNPANEQTYEAWTVALRIPGQRQGIVAEYVALAEGSPAQAAAFATGHAFPAAGKAPKWIAPLEAAIANPDKATIGALKKALGADKKLDKETLASIEQVVQQLK
jgi:hypothetical protein